MENYLKNITPEMTRTVNNLINRDFENATKEEIEIYAEWSKLFALKDSERQQRREQRDAVIAQRIENSRNESKAAVDALNALTELAKAKLAEVENGQA